MKLSVLDRIKNNVKVVPCKLYPELGDCWEWQKGCDTSGYGSISIYNKTNTVHRVMWKIVYGDILNNLNVLHKCDNPKCCNPYHLWLGTHQDNVDDMLKKGRENKAIGERNGRKTHPEKIPRGENHYAKLYPEKVPRGEKCGSSKFKNLEIDEIFKLKKNGWLQKDIAKKFNVHRKTIGRILLKQSWKHIP